MRSRHLVDSRRRPVPLAEAGVTSCIMSAAAGPLISPLNRDASSLSISRFLRNPSSGARLPALLSLPQAALQGALGEQRARTLERKHPRRSGRCRYTAPPSSPAARRSRPDGGSTGPRRSGACTPRPGVIQPLISTPRMSGMRVAHHTSVSAAPLWCSTGADRQAMAIWFSPRP